MKTNIKNLTASILGGVALSMLCGTAQADLTVSNSTTLTSWNQVNGQSPFYVSIASGSLGSATTGQGQPSMNAGATRTVLSETFTITNGAGGLAIGNTNYVLTGIAILGANQPVNSSIHLYDITTNLTSNNGTPFNGPGATYNFNVNGDLFGNGSGLSLSNIIGGTDQVLYELTSGPNTPDQVVLGAGHTYAFEVWTPTGGFTWFRLPSGTPADPGGQGMGSHDSSLAVARLTITSLGLAGGAPRTLTLALYGTPTSAPLSVNNNTNAVPLTNYLVDSFNTFGYGPTNLYVGTNDYSLGQITNIWVNWFGTAFSNLTWDAASDAQNNPSSGSLKIIALFPDAGIGGQFGPQFVVMDNYNGINPSLNGLNITGFECDIRFDPSSATQVDAGVTNFGGVEFGTRGIDFSQYDFGTVSVPVTQTNWVHVSLPVNAVANTSITNIPNVFVKMYSGTRTGTSILWVDNVKLVGPSVIVAPPVPTMSLERATPGLRIFAGSTANTYDRAEVATIDNNQSWIGGSFPVSYSFRLLSYPANINQTHIFLIPVNTSGQANMGNVGGSVNEFIDYQATNGMWLVLQPFGGGQVTASVMWKTNLANANPNQTALVFTNPTAIGTWTLTFETDNSGTVTGPGGASHAFTITNGTVATDFANPLVAYFGLQPNSSTGIGQYEDWGSISVTGVTGANENDNFTTDTSFNTSLWNINTITVARQTSVQLVTAATPYWINWSQPAGGYDLGAGTNFMAPGNDNTPGGWMLPEYYNNYNDGNTIPGQASQGVNTWVLLPDTCIPTVTGSPGGARAPTVYFRLFSPPLAN